MYSNQPNPKAFLSLRKHNIKKRFNIWQENKETGEIVASHLHNSYTNLENAIEKAQEFQEFTDKCEGGKYIYHVDIEILIESSEGENLVEGDELAYAITVYPQVKDFLERTIW